jgi:hypothetical protein
LIGPPTAFAGTAGPLRISSWRSASGTHRHTGSRATRTGLARRSCRTKTLRRAGTWLPTRRRSTGANWKPLALRRRTATGSRCSRACSRCRCRTSRWSRCGGSLRRRSTRLPGHRRSKRNSGTRRRRRYSRSCCSRRRSRRRSHGFRSGRLRRRMGWWMSGRMSARR